MQNMGEFPHVVEGVGNPFNDNRLAVEAATEKAIQEKIRRIWERLEVDEFGPMPAIEDISRYQWQKKPIVLRRYLEDFTPEDYQEILDLLWSKARADETRLADSKRPWDVHIQRVYFSVMPSNDGPRYDEALSSLTKKRVDTFVNALEGLAQGRQVNEADLFPFDNEYFIERKFPPDELARLVRMFQDDLASLKISEDINRRPGAGQILRHYRAITSVADTTHRYHDDPGLMTISVFRARTNQLNGVISDLKRLAAGKDVPGLDRDTSYPGYVKDDYDKLIAMLENERLLLLDMSKKQPPPEGVGNDFSDVEDVAKVD